MRKILFFVFLSLSGLLRSQEEAPPGASPFPLGPVLAEAIYGEGRWRPDWPLEIAPDAFTVKGSPAAITVELGGIREAGAGESASRESAAGAPPYPGIPYRLARDSGGRLASFPMALGMAGGNPPALVFAQVEVLRGEGVQELRILVPAPPGSAGDPGDILVWSVLFPSPCLPGMPPAGDPVKVQCGEDLYYALFGGGGNRITETWYDPWGNFAAYFETRIGLPEAAGPCVLGVRGKDFNRDCHYESGGNLSECSGDQGFYSAVYGRGGRPLYWRAGQEYGGREYGLSWDEEGRLTGMRDLGPGVPGEEPLPAAFRYEYEFDSRGNWILRREIALFRRENLLIPERMRETVRRIDYPEGD
jgi:hypothetical protein